MSIRTKKILSFMAIAAFFAVPFLAGAQFDPLRGQGDANLASTSVYEIISTIMKWLLLILTVLAVIGFIISGITFITAGGSDRAESAKKWLVYSIIGIVVALIGYIILNLVDTLLKGNVQT